MASTAPERSKIFASRFGWRSHNSIVYSPWPPPNGKTGSFQKVNHGPLFVSEEASIHRSVIAVSW
jgi:hypothetical protein